VYILQHISNIPN